MSYPYGVVQNCSNSIANTLELLQSCTKPSISRDQYQIVEDIGLFTVSYSADTKNTQILQASLNMKYIAWSTTGPRLNIKTVLSTYGDFHVKDKTAVRTSYL